MRHQRKKRVPRSSAAQTTKQKATRRRRAAVRKKLMTELRGPKLAKNAPMIGQGSNLNIGLRGAGAAVGDVAGVDVLKKSHRKSKKKRRGKKKRSVDAPGDLGSRGEPIMMNQDRVKTVDTKQLTGQRPLNPLQLYRSQLVAGE